MKSITLHKMDDELARTLSEEARQQGISMNRKAQELLRERLNLIPLKDKAESFQEFCGRWTEAQAEVFSANTADLRQIDAADWQ